MRDDEALGSCFVPRDDIGGTLQGELDKVAPSGGRADSREGICNAERFMQNPP
jgi:hypothetical protein